MNRLQLLNDLSKNGKTLKYSLMHAVYVHTTPIIKELWVARYHLIHTRKLLGENRMFRTKFY